MSNRIIIDLDGTLTVPSDKPYEDAIPNREVIAKLKTFKGLGYQIAIFTSRNMRTYEGNVGLINVNTLPVIMAWLKKHEVPFDELLVGKPWCGNDGFYIDDRALRPDEFVNLSPEQIALLLSERR